MIRVDKNKVKIRMASTRLEGVVFGLDMIKTFRKINPNIDFTTAGVFCLLCLIGKLGVKDGSEYFAASYERIADAFMGLSNVNLCKIKNKKEGFYGEIIVLTDKGKKVKAKLTKLLR
tara:strand:+ start:680 stop:1030 length:351 start_codon:yes stop_codon:yes gene_type:complete